MATRKAITLVSGLFEEVNTPTDKLDFAGNTTADLGENTNLYFTNARARSAVSVTDAGGLGSLAYNSSTGVITYTGPSNSDIRGLLSIASGSGLTYNSSTGEFGTSAIPNSQLANDDITIGSTAVALGATQGTFTGLTSLTSATLKSGTGSANVVTISSGNLLFSGSTADANGTTLQVTDPTASRTITLPDESGTVLTSASSIPNSGLANSTVTIGSTSVALGATVTSFTGISSITSAAVLANANGSRIFDNGDTTKQLAFDVSNISTSTTRTLTIPNANGTVALLTSLSIASGSGLTYNSSTGEFSTNAIPNSKLANSSITIGGTGVALGGSITTFSGLSSVTADAVVTKTGGFRVIDSTDNTKQVAFDASAISGSTTRTLAVPDVSDTLVLLGATQTLTNKTIALGSNTVTGALANGITATTQSASDNSTKVATTAYVDNQVTAGATNEFADNVFRVKDNSDASKKLAFECSGISGSTTRTMTVPNTDGTISTESFATAIAVALG